MSINELYTEYFNDIYRSVFSLSKNRSLTDDIVQETFTRAYLNLDNFGSQPNKAWLFTVARNIYYDHLRKNKRIFNTDYDFSSVPDRSETPEEKLFREENIKNLHKEIQNLKGNYRDAIIFFYVKELSYKEAAIEMNVTESNFKSILFRAKQKLKRSLERKGESLE